MRRLFFAVFIAWGLISQSFAQQVSHVVLVSIDGLRPEFYKDPAWNTPNLHLLKSNGVYADGVRGVFPSVTYPSHTTIITGALPARHGVYYNERFSRDGRQGIWYWQADLIKSPTLWDAVKKAGLTAAAISWPVSVGAPVNFDIPEFWDPEDKKDRISPIRAKAYPAGLLAELEQNATGKLTSDDFNSDFLTMDENLGRMASYLIRTYKPNFTAVHLVCVDHYEHADGREGLAVKKAVASADHAVGDIIEAILRAGIKDSTVVIITGDHGFVDIHTSLAPNVWLARQGLVSGKGEDLKWKAIFHTSGASAFLHLYRKGDKKTLDEVLQTLHRLPASTRKLFRIVSKQELRAAGADPDAELALAPVPGISMTGDREGDDLRAAKGGTHGYFPDFKEIQTGFIACGPAINKGVVLPQMGLEDVAPVVARLLHLDFKAPDGVLYPGIIKPDNKLRDTNMR